MPVDERYAYVTLSDGTKFQELKEIQAGVDDRGLPVMATVYDEAATAAKIQAHLAPPPPPAKKK